jgi:hypothetical protein
MANEEEVYSSTPIHQDYLKDGYYIFGNKGNVWTDTAHIYKSGYGNLCKTPALSFNHAKYEGVTHSGCTICNIIYRKENEPNYK